MMLCINNVWYKNKLYLNSISDKKANFRISRGMKPTTRHGEIFLGYFHTQDLVSGLISTIVIVFYLYISKL